MPWKTSIPLKDMSHICVCGYDRMIHFDRKHSPKLALMLITAWKALENLKVLDMCCSKMIVTLDFYADDTQVYLPAQCYWRN